MSVPERITVLPDAAGGSALSRAAEVMRAGGLVVFPTETFYGLGADPRNEGAMERLFALKGRPASAPILLLLSGVEQVSLVAAPPPPEFSALTRAFWPGPLTLVVRASETLSERVTSGTGTVGLRVSGSPWPRELARSMRWPVTGTSANLSGKAPLRTPDDLAEALGASLAMIDLLIDAGPAPGGAPSTVIDLTGGRPRLIRAGAIRFEDIEAALGDRQA